MKVQREILRQFRPTEDLIEDKTVLVSITTANYIKRMDIDTYRKQRRGGHGITGMTTKEEDFVESVFVADMKDYLLCFTNIGRIYWLKVYQIPESSRIAKGKPLVNLLNLKDEVVTTVLPIKAFREDEFLLFATKFGQAIKIRLDEFDNPRSTGTNAIKLKENDRLVDVILTNGNNELVLTTRFGQSLRFHEETVRTVGRNAQGVRGMKLRGEDTIVAVTLLAKDHLLTISDVGYGKRSEFDEFRGHGRGTMGVRNMQLERDAVVIESRAVSDTDEIIAMTASGVVTTLAGQTNWVYATGWNATGTHAFTASWDGTIRIWDTPGYTQRSLITTALTTLRLQTAVWNPTVDELAAPDAPGGTVRVWDGSTGTALRELTGTAGPVWGVAYSPDGTRVASTGGDGVVRLWNAADGTQTASVVVGGYLRSVAWSPTGDRIAVAGNSGAGGIWNATSLASAGGDASHGDRTNAMFRK